jgi:hypothetical protein
MLNRRGSPADERGAVVIIVAILVLFLFAMVAFVVDIGAAQTERRQDQTAADGGVLAGAQLLTVGNSVKAATTAMDVARKNLPRTFSDAEWSAAWSACADAGRDTTRYPIVSSVSPCISFNAGFTRMRVRIPIQTLNTAFAGVVNVSTMDVRADAEAQINYIAGAGIPFAIRNDAGKSDQLCAKYPGTCQDPNEDPLRPIDSPLVGNEQYGTSAACNINLPNATIGSRAANNISVGLDHSVVIYDVAAGQKRYDRCGVQLPYHLNARELQDFADNNPAQYAKFLGGIGQGLISGSTFSDGGPARLLRYPAWSPPWRTRMVSGFMVDDRPLWDFIPRSLGAGSIPAQCTRAAFDTTPTKVQMSNCLLAYANRPVGTYAPLFSERSASTPNGMYDIQLSPRFGLAPVVTPTDQGQEPWAIERFRPVFVETIYLHATDSRCLTCTEYNPGEGTADIPDTVFAGMSAFPIMDEMLPFPLADIGPTGLRRAAPVLIK